MMFLEQMHRIKGLLASFTRNEKVINQRMHSGKKALFYTQKLDP